MACLEWAFETHKNHLFFPTTQKYIHTVAARHHTAMGFVGVQQASSRPTGKTRRHPPVTYMKRRMLIPKHLRVRKKRKPNHVPFLDGLPLEILEQIFVESANPDLVLVNKAIFSALNSTCIFLRSSMLLNWVEKKEPERVETRETTATAEPEQQEQQEQNGQTGEMTQEQIDQDINNHIHHPQTFHIDDMVVDPPAPPQQDNTDIAQRAPAKYTLPVEQLKWKFVTRELLESLDVEVSGTYIPSTYAAVDATQRQKDLLPLLKKSGLKFQNLSQVISKAAIDADHFKHLVKLDFGPPTIACLIAALRATNGEDLLKSRSNMDLLPNWLIRSGYYVDKLSSDELWSFLVAYPDRNLVRYFLQLGVVPSERLLHQIPAL